MVSIARLNQATESLYKLAELKKKPSSQGVVISDTLLEMKRPFPRGK